MVRLLMSNKAEGVYEYSFEPLTEENIEKAVARFLRKYGYARRIRVNPCDSRIRALSLALLDKDRRLEFKSSCCDKINAEYTGFIVDKNELIDKVRELLMRIYNEYKECAKNYSEKLLI